MTPFTEAESNLIFDYLNIAKERSKHDYATALLLLSEAFQKSEAEVEQCYNNRF